MDYREAVELKTGDKVWVNFKPQAGHGRPINELGTVKCGPYDHDARKPSININGTKYIGILVYVSSEQHASVYPSWCLTMKGR